MPRKPMFSEAARLGVLALPVLHHLQHLGVALVGRDEHALGRGHVDVEGKLDAQAPQQVDDGPDLSDLDLGRSEIAELAARCRVEHLGGNLSGSPRAMSESENQM